MLEKDLTGLPDVIRAEKRIKPDFCGHPKLYPKRFTALEKLVINCNGKIGIYRLRELP